MKMCHCLKCINKIISDSNGNDRGPDKLNLVEKVEDHLLDKYEDIDEDVDYCQLMTYLESLMSNKLAFLTGERALNDLKNALKIKYREIKRINNGRR